MKLKIAFLLSVAGLIADQRISPHEALFPIEIQGKWGFIDIQGKIVVEPKYDQTSAFAEGLGGFRQGDKWGYLDVKGKVAIPAKLQQTTAEPFSGPGALAYAGPGIMGFVDRAGTLILNKAWEKASSVGEGLMAVRENRKWGFLSTTGQMVIPLKFDDALTFTDGLCAVKLNGKWGLIDKSGAFVLEPRFKFLSHPSGGLAPFLGDNEKWGVVNVSGKVVVEPTFAEVMSFSEGLARVLIVGNDKITRTGFIDATGKLVVAAIYPAASDLIDGRAMVRVGEKYGYIDKTGKLVIPAIYDYAAQFDSGLAFVQTFQDPKKPIKYYVNPAGKIVWKSR